MKKILVLMIAALMLCSFVFTMTSCDKENDADQGQSNQNNNNQNNNDDDVHTHSMSDWATVTNATCTTDGSEARSCTSSDCTYTESRTVAALGHDLKEHAADAPGCAEHGYNAYVECKRCDYTTYSEIAATGHNYTVNAELNPNGNVCVNCGQSHICVDTNFTDWKVVEEADCTTAGKQECKCSVCNYVKEITVEKSEHAYGDDGKCLECGAEETDIPELPDAEL